jgi:hypothetical protein
VLTLTIRDQEHFDDETNKFVEGPTIVTLELEHSLFSLKTWESKWKKPFLSSDKTSEETVDYVKIMTLNDVPETAFGRLTQEHYNQVAEYINDPHTATWFSETPGGRSGPQKEIITAEIIYYWIISLNIDFETQYWNLSQLLALVRVCNEKNTPEKKKRKMSMSDLAAQRRALNEKRRRDMGTKG